jgi:hypothetical protein
MHLHRLMKMSGLNPLPSRLLRLGLVLMRYKATRLSSLVGMAWHGTYCMCFRLLPTDTSDTCSPRALNSDELDPAVCCSLSVRLRPVDPGGRVDGWTYGITSLHAHSNNNTDKIERHRLISMLSRRSLADNAQSQALASPEVVMTPAEGSAIGNPPCLP